MNFRFDPSLMSLRARFQPEAPKAPVRETDAAEALAAHRGRAPIQAAPKAGRAASALVRALAPSGAMGLSELKRRWADLASEPFASKTEPDALAAGILTLRVPSALAPLVQQQIPLLIQRLQLGGAKIREIRIAQRLAAKRRKSNVAPARHEISAAEDAALQAALAGVDDPKLKTALLRLGRAVKQP